jgi:hypothetical protein
MAATRLDAIGNNMFGQKENSGEKAGRRGEHRPSFEALH